MKKCIFYLPYELDEHGMGARMLRPRKMIQAFADIGYDVYVITGYSNVRRERIVDLKQRISNGEKYDFMYTESHTEPTLLTDPHHLPTHPFLDFGFFRYIKNQGIRIGLFLCDIYWKFDSYGSELPAWKRRGALLCYNYDIKQYKKYLDKLYLADMKVSDYIAEDILTRISEELPPGADRIEAHSKDYSDRDFNKKPLTIFYVGGLGSQYQIVELAKAVRMTENSKLIICCRDFEWEREKNNFEPYLCDRIEIIHKNSDELEPYYIDADICSLLFKRDIYIEMAKPFKSFEYLAHEIPVLSTRGTAIGTFVENNDIGWNIDFNADDISSTLTGIIANPECISEKVANCAIAKKSNLWTSRAKKVAEDLS